MGAAGAGVVRHRMSRLTRPDVARACVTGEAARPPPRARERWVRGAYLPEFRGGRGQPGEPPLSWLTAAASPCNSCARFRASTDLVRISDRDTRRARFPRAA